MTPMLVILTTHPIQYQVPLWQALARGGRVPFEVWYLTDHGARVTWDKEFGRKFAWDLPLREGYPHRFLKVNPDWVMDLARPHGIRLAEPIGPLLQTRGVTHLLVNGWHKLAYWQAVSQARRAGVKIWLRAESNDLASPPAWRRIVRREVHRQIFRHVDDFLCIGSGNRRLFQKAGAPIAHLWSAPYCVDNARFARQASELRGRRSELRREWGIPVDAFCVLFCGKFIAKKRPFDVVEAVARLADRGGGGRIAGFRNREPRRPHLLFVGSGALGGELRAATNVVHDVEAASPAKARPDLPPATFAGFLNQTEISRAYVAADCLVLPSNADETWGLVVNEAMASGLPCAVSDAIGCGEDLVAPVAAWLRYPLGNVAALAATLGEIEWNPPQPAVLEDQVAKFSFAVTLDTIAHLYGDPVRAASRESGNPVV